MEKNKLIIKKTEVTCDPVGSPGLKVCFWLKKSIFIPEQWMQFIFFSIFLDRSITLFSKTMIQNTEHAMIKIGGRDQISPILATFQCQSWKKKQNLKFFYERMQL